MTSQVQPVAVCARRIPNEFLCRRWVLPAKVCTCVEPHASRQRAHSRAVVAHFTSTATPAFQRSADLVHTAFAPATVRDTFTETSLFDATFARAASGRTTVAAPIVAAFTSITSGCAQAFQFLGMIPVVADTQGVVAIGEAASMTGTGHAVARIV